MSLDLYFFFKFRFDRGEQCEQCHGQRVKQIIICKNNLNTHTINKVPVDKYKI